MSVTNAISGMVGVGGLFIMGGGYFPGTIPQALGALSVLLASVNVAGGFVITKRMLDMFKRGFGIRSLAQNYSPMGSVGPTDPPEYNWLYSIPAAVFTGGFLLAAQTGFAGLVQAGYLASSILCIGSSLVSRFKSLYHPQTIPARLSHRPGLPVYRKTGQRPRYARRWLRFRYILGRRWIPTSRPRAIRYVGCRGRDHWLHHWEEDYRH